jgi:hypothetical protein
LKRGAFWGNSSLMQLRELVVAINQLVKALPNIKEEREEVD